MAKKKAKVDSRVSGSDSIIIADGEELNLRNRQLAGFLAWLLPGAGHFYQRRYFKSAVFSTSIFSIFLIGLFVSDNKCVYASWNDVEKRWHFALQAGIGLPVMPAVLQTLRSRPNPEGFMAPPSSVKMLDDWHQETASGFDMGTLYTMIAGLLNVLVVFDAYAGPLPPPVQNKRGSKQQPPDDSEPPGRSDTGPQTD